MKATSLILDASSAAHLAFLVLSVSHKILKSVVFFVFDFQRRRLGR